MGKLLNHFNKQLQTELSKDAEDCLKLYNYLKETTGHVWESQWQLLTTVKFKGFPSDNRFYKPSQIGYDLLKTIEQSQLKTKKS